MIPFTHQEWLYFNEKVSELVIFHFFVKNRIFKYTPRFFNILSKIFMFLQPHPHFMVSIFT